jgi:hypothetical protein
MAAATHRGHCQLCGSLQKLPKGVLSLHGYTVTHGFFSGVCSGAKALPFEQSMELVAAHVQLAKNRIKDIKKYQHELRTNIDADTKMFISTYVKNLHGAYRSGYVTEQVELTASMPPAEADGWQRIEYSYTDANNQNGGHYSSGFHGVAPYEMPGATCEELRRATVLKYNSLHADSMNREVRQLEAYIAWQTERCKNWSVKPLVPVSGKFANVAFKPEDVK